MRRLALSASLISALLFVLAAGSPGAPRAAAASERYHYAHAIVHIGHRRGESKRVIIAALEAAIVESNLHNLNYGSGDSVGLFQQRPSMGWGTRAQIRDPHYAIRAFYAGAGSNHGARWCARQHPRYSSGRVAQCVQRSAFPDRYEHARREASAFYARG
jgi:hypothetical protein